MDKLTNLQAEINSLDVDLSEKFLLAGCKDAILRIFSIKETEVDIFHEIPGHSASITKALFINNGEIIASADFKGKLILWKLEGKKYNKKVEIQVSDGPIYDICFRFINELEVFCGCENGILKGVLFDTSLGYKVTEQKILNHAVVSVSCNDLFLVGGSLDSSVSFVSRDSMEKLEYHQSPVLFVSISKITSEGKAVFATASKDRKVFVILKNKECIKKHEIQVDGQVNSLGWDNPGFVLTISYGDEKFRSFILNEMDELKEVELEMIENK